MQPALCIGVILSAILLFWFGIAGNYSDREAVQSQIQEADNLYANQGLADANESLSADSKPAIFSQRTSNSLNKLSISGKGMVNRVFFFEINDSDKSQVSAEEVEFMDLHLRALRGKTFAERLTKSIESSEAAEKMLLQPFQGESIILGNIQIVQSLFSARITTSEKVQEKLAISVQAEDLLTREWLQLLLGILNGTIYKQ